MGLFDRIKQGLRRTRESFSGRVDELVENTARIDEDFYDELSDILIMADVGVKTTEEIIDGLKKTVRENGITDPAQARERLKRILAAMMASETMQLPSPLILLVIGVNGVGKTTSIGKLAQRMKDMRRRVIICAADTYRAAAMEQLEVWAQRADCPIIKQGDGADPASVVYDAIQVSRARHADVMLVDTAGRLHNKAQLMEELRKISRVAEREYPEATVKALLVIDATTGQNGLNQARVFSDVANVDGIILTKLDGTAKGGIALAIRRELALPVRYIGFGEGIDDMQPFDAKEFVEAIVG